jgi:hypothetical protein
MPEGIDQHGSDFSYQRLLVGCEIRDFDFHWSFSRVWSAPVR